MKRQRVAAQWFCLVVGGLLALRGVLGFLIADASFDLPGEGWHTLVHLVTGVALIGAARSRRLAIGAALAFGLFYIAVSVTGAIDGSDFLGFIPVKTDDHVFHAIIGLASLLAGIFSGGPEPASAAPAGAS